MRREPTRPPVRPHPLRSLPPKSCQFPLFKVCPTDLTKEWDTPTLAGMLKRAPLFPDTPGRKGISPKWANLPKRKCDDCGASYKPARPLMSEQRGFCSDNCRKSYHKHGGAYRKLKTEMTKMVERRMAEIENRLFRTMADIEKNLFDTRLRLAAESAPPSHQPAAIPPALQPANAKADGRRIPTRR